MTDTQAPTIIDKVQDGIIEQLKRWLGSKFYINDFPANPKNFDRNKMTHICLVQLSQGRYGTSDDTATQWRTLRFNIILMIRNLDRAGEAYAYMESIRNALQFHKIASSRPIQMVSESLAGEENGAWEWHVKVDVTVPAFARQTDRAVRPIIPNSNEEAA